MILVELQHTNRLHFHREKGTVAPIWNHHAALGCAAGSRQRAAAGHNDLLARSAFVALLLSFASAFVENTETRAASPAAPLIGPITQH